MGPEAMLAGELPFTGQLPCLSMDCMPALLSWGALQLSVTSSWGGACSRALAAKELSMPCQTPLLLRQLASLSC